MATYDSNNMDHRNKLIIIVFLLSLCIGCKQKKSDKERYRQALRGCAEKKYTEDLYVEISSKEIIQDTILQVKIKGKKDTSVTLALPKILSYSSPNMTGELRRTRIHHKVYLTDTVYLKHSNTLMKLHSFQLGISPSFSMLSKDWRCTLTKIIVNDSIHEKKGGVRINVE